jgi:hypothetical protein
MRIIVYIIFGLVILAMVYFFTKIIKDSKKDLLKTMLKNNDITNETYLKYLDKL